MKLYKICISGILFLGCFAVSGQSIGDGSSVLDIDSAFKASKRITPCITDAEYQRIENQSNDNVAILGLNNVNKISTPQLLEWPLREAAGFKDCSYYFIGAYVDQNTAVGAFKDYNCETNTYDSHHGTDIAVWPFGFYKMDSSLVEVIAAAPGTIIDKHDGEFDRNCSVNNLTANYVVIQHADGSRALYWHMKKGSVSSKAIGASVSVGEYLGVAGSSGSSSGPHLHFEVWAGSTSSTYNDPFSGSCNLLNASSWWASQKAHSESAVIKASLHITDISIPSCPSSGVTNESTSFVVPFQGPGLTAGYAKFYIFLREALSGGSVSLSILNPDNTVFNSWSYTIPSYFKTYYYGFSKKLPLIAGTYKFQATYNGISCSQNFDILSSTSVLDKISILPFDIYPNPSNGNFNLVAEDMDKGKYSFILKNNLGQLLSSEEVFIDKGRFKKTISLSKYPDGFYFLSISNSKENTVRKLLKFD